MLLVYYICCYLKRVHSLFPLSSWSFYCLFSLQTFLCMFHVPQQCRHPLELFSMFHDPRVSHDDVVHHDLLPGMHELPRTCEYCGASDTDLCTAECQRPKSFFRKKRPPFCPPDSTQWDPVTDYELEKPRPQPKAKVDDGHNHHPHDGTASFFNFGDLFQ